MKILAFILFLGCFIDITTTTALGIKEIKTLKRAVNLKDKQFLEVVYIYTMNIIAVIFFLMFLFRY